MKIRGRKAVAFSFQDSIYKILHELKLEKMLPFLCAPSFTQRINIYVSRNRFNVFKQEAMTVTKIVYWSQSL